MREIESMLERQAQWQRERARLSWADKIRQAARLRASLLELRRMRIRTSSDSVRAGHPVTHHPEAGQ